MNKKLTVGLLAAATISAPLSAQFYSSLNPSIDLGDYGITENSGIVVEILGVNGAHVVSQLAPQDLYNGFFDDGFGSTVGPFGSNALAGYAGAPAAGAGVWEFAGIIGEQLGWDAFDFGGAIAKINIEMTLFGFEGGNNLGTDFLYVNGVDLSLGESLFDLGNLYSSSGLGTAEFMSTGEIPEYNAILNDLSFGYLNFALAEENMGFTAVEFYDTFGGSLPSNSSIGPIQVIPEPSFIALISFGFIGTLLGTYRRRR